MKLAEEKKWIYVNYVTYHSFTTSTSSTLLEQLSFVAAIRGVLPRIRSRSPPVLVPMNKPGQYQPFGPVIMEVKYHVSLR